MEAIALVTMISINIASVVYVISQAMKFVVRVTEYLHGQEKED